MKGIMKEMVVKGLAFGISSMMLASNATSMIRVARTAGLSDDDIRQLKDEIEEDLRKTEAEGREYRDALIDIAKGALAEISGGKRE